MRKFSSAFLFIGLGAASLWGQENKLPVTLGFKVGVPITDMFQASNTTNFLNGNTSGLPGSNYTSAVPRYTFGVSGEFHLPYNLRFEVDGLFKRGGFDWSGPYAATGNVAYHPTTFNVWEIPALFKYNLSSSRWRPFVDFGASLRHISTITEKTYAGLGYATLNNNSPALHNRNSYGGVAGLGLTFKKGPFELSPEVRYTRWANESFQTSGLRTNLDQGDFLLGISF
jgi:Outer membrane protein beta-barrel domain